MIGKQLEVLLLGALPFVECGEIEQEITKSGCGQCGHWISHLESKAANFSVTGSISGDLGELLCS